MSIGRKYVAAGYAIMMRICHTLVACKATNPTLTPLPPVLDLTVSARAVLTGCVRTIPGCSNTKRHTMHAAFPMGLPEFDPVRLTIEGGEGLEVNKL